MKILTVPSQNLTQKSEPVEKFDKQLAKTIKQMEKTLAKTFDPKGVGLSAPQVGIQKRFFIIKPRDEDPLLTIINPIILEATNEGKKKKILEGCLSIPDIWGDVTRPNRLKLEFVDINGKKQTESFKGFFSSVIQHEIDHLDGILFTQRVMEQGEKLYKSHKNSDGEDIFEEIEL